MGKRDDGFGADCIVEECMAVETFRVSPRRRGPVCRDSIVSAISKEKWLYFCIFINIFISSWQIYGRREVECEFCYWRGTALRLA
jgi:hypothetical protein